MFFSPSRKRTDITFGMVVVNTQLPVIGIANEFFPLIKGIPHRFANITFRRELWLGFIQPCFELS